MYEVKSSLAHPHRILIVEDDRTLATAVKNFLEIEGICSVELAFDYQSGFELGCKNRYNAAIVDLNLGGIDGPKLKGLELIQAIQDEGGRYPFMVFSAYIDFDTRVRAHRMGAVCFMRKPIGAQSLCDDEFVAAISALIYMGTPEEDEKTLESTVIQRGPVTIDVDKSVVHISGREFDKFTPMELKVLVCIMQKRHATMDELISHVYGNTDKKKYLDNRQNIQTFISRIRRKVRSITDVNPIVYKNLKYRIFWPIDDTDNPAL